MSIAVVVGPSTVCGPGVVDDELVSVALEGIDDEFALVDRDVIPTDRLWRDVLGSAVPGRCDELVLVCPSWWPSARLALVKEAARDSAENVVLVRRPDVLAPSSTLVEISLEVVVVHTDTRLEVFARTGESHRDVDAIAACLDGLDAVTIDAPSGSEIVAAELSRALRNRGVEATVVGDREVARRARSRPAEVVRRPSLRAAVTPRAAVLAGATLAVVALTTAALRIGAEPTATEAEPIEVTWLVEGRVAVEVPAAWRVERITSGPGSARVQVISPDDGSVALQLVQSPVPGRALDSMAEELRAALAAEPAGVFVGFEATAQRAGRPVLTYREMRADRRVTWVVLVDRGVRIAIGCQGRVASAGPERQCDRAVASARAVA